MKGNGIQVTCEEIEGCRPSRETKGQRQRKEKSGVVRCEIRGCKNWADKTMGGRRIAYDRAVDVWGEDLLSSDSRRLSVCKQHYKEWKKARKDDPDEWS